MSAFLDLLQAYSIWLYIIGAFVILFAIKMLVDSRRQARTTLFTLEQEQAGERALRAALLMVGTMVVILGILGINTFVAPARPQLTPVATKQSAAMYTPAIVLPTFTTVPTLTPEGPSPTPTVAASQTVTPTRSVQPTLSPAPPTAASAPPTQAPPPEPTKPAVQPATTTYIKPPLSRPVNGDRISSGKIQFIWGPNDEVPAHLPPGQFYKVIVQFKARDTNAPMTLVKCTADSSVDTKQWGKALGDAQGSAVDSLLSWSVVVMQVPSGKPGDCDAGAGTPISPPSDTWNFFWP